MNIDKFDIIVINDKIVQYLGKEMDNGAIVQDIHCRKELIHIALIKRKANKDETKWFCEKTENSEFTPPLEDVNKEKEMEKQQKKDAYLKGIKNYDPTFKSE